MNDEQLIETMRAMSSSTPAVRVDRERVLARGRRRRTVRAAGIAGAAGMLCTGLVVGALAWQVPDGGPTPVPAPAASTSAPEPESDSSADTAEEPTSWETYPASPDDGEHGVVDHEHGTIRLPEDDWVLTAAEQAVVDTAQQYLQIECLTDLGLGDEVEFVGPVPPYDERRRGLGLWSEEDLERDYDVVVDRGAFWFGYQDDDPRLNDTTVSGDDPSVPAARWQGCSDEAESRLRGMSPQQWRESAWSAGTGGRPDLAVYLGTSFRTEETMQNLEPDVRRVARQAREIVVEWEQCIASEGLRATDAQAMVPDGLHDFEAGYTREQRQVRADIAEWVAEREAAAEPQRAPAEWPPPELGYSAEETAFLDEPEPLPVLVGTAEERQRVAEVDIRCKQTLGTVQRLADLDAAVQVEYIADNPEYFESRREISRRMLANAQDVLARAGVEMP
ncbi:hypothetical protein [Isoptericola sp. AK164]|uniref:hypothetical protein n=1 Tax=Isoptericola sp. AK164 TaxID=3024246 RepID=UPI0024189D85|nr:hypothetical protein [Isoptericola sp. AK164]